MLPALTAWIAVWLKNITAQRVTRSSDSMKIRRKKSGSTSWIHKLLRPRLPFNTRNKKKTSTRAKQDGRSKKMFARRLTFIRIFGSWTVGRWLIIFLISQPILHLNKKISNEIPTHIGNTFPSKIRQLFIKFFIHFVNNQRNNFSILQFFLFS